jgi:hypothetical protein
LNQIPTLSLKNDNLTIELHLLLHAQLTLGTKTSEVQAGAEAGAGAVTRVVCLLLLRRTFFLVIFRSTSGNMPLYRRPPRHLYCNNVLLLLGGVVLALYNLTQSAPTPWAFRFRGIGRRDILKQGFRPAESIYCKQQGTCDGRFEYIPCQSFAPPSPTADAREACLRSWANASEAGADRSRFQEDLLIYEHFFKK